MPLPIFSVLALGAIVHGVRNARTIHDAKDSIESAENRHQTNLKRFEEEKSTTGEVVENYENTKLEIVSSFVRFTDVFSVIHNKPQFKAYCRDGVEIPEYSGDQIKSVSKGAEFLLNGITGTIATNTTSAIMGFSFIGGSIAVIFNTIRAYSISKKAEEAWSQVERAEEEIDEICSYMKEMKSMANKYVKSLLSVNEVYLHHLGKLNDFIIVNKKTDWNDFNSSERLITENTVLLVGLLYNMCKVHLVQESKNENEYNEINSVEIEESIDNAKRFLDSRKDDLYVS